LLSRFSYYQHTLSMRLPKPQTNSIGEDAQSTCYT
jgi:hypothetical protein